MERVSHLVGPVSSLVLALALSWLVGKFWHRNWWWSNLVFASTRGSFVDEMIWALRGAMVSLSFGLFSLSFVYFSLDLIRPLANGGDIGVIIAGGLVISIAITAVIVTVSASVQYHNRQSRPNSR